MIEPPADVALLLDANCIVYYCMRFDEVVHGVSASFYHPLGDHVIQAIKPISEAGRCVGTTSAILAEIPDKGAEELIDDFIYNSDIIRKLRQSGIGFPPPRIRERWQRAFIQKFRKFRNKPWFREIPFTPLEPELEGAKVFYASLAGEPEMAEHIARKGHDCPSKEDLALAICAKQLQVPILSNDSDFTKFIGPWSRFGITIRPLI